MKSTGWIGSAHKPRVGRQISTRRDLGCRFHYLGMIGSCRPCASSEWAPVAAGGILVDAARDVHRQCPPGKNAMKHNPNCPPSSLSPVALAPVVAVSPPLGRSNWLANPKPKASVPAAICRKCKLGSIGKVFREPRLVVDHLSPVSRVSHPSPAPPRPLQPPNAGRGVFSQRSIRVPQP